MTLPQAIVQLIGVIFLLTIIWKLLSRTKLLPFTLYLIGVNNIYPVWVAEHQLAYYGIMALCLLYPAAYWLLRCRQYRQEEAEAKGELLAIAYAHHQDEPLPASAGGDPADGRGEERIRMTRDRGRRAAARRPFFQSIRSARIFLLREGPIGCILVSDQLVPPL